MFYLQLSMTDTLTVPTLDVDHLKTLIAVEDNLLKQREIARKDIGAHLRSMRLNRKLSFRKAGKLLGCDPGLLNRVEKGNTWAYTIVEKALTTYPSIPLVEDISHE
jgi:hypothetical protein